MVTFKQYLKELFDSTYKWKSIGNGAYSFKTDKGSETIVDFFDYGTHSEVEFTVDSKGWATGTGDAFKIFSTVLDILKHHLAKVEPKKLIFTADKTMDGESRSKLYKAMVDRFARQYGYSVMVKDNRYDSIFVLKKT